MPLPESAIRTCPVRSSRSARTRSRVGPYSGLFVDAMHAAKAVPAHLVADAQMVKKYGMGMVFAGGAGLANLRKAGYIVEAPTIRALAEQIGVDPQGLESTVAKMNEYAKTGADLDFQFPDPVRDRRLHDAERVGGPAEGVLFGDGDEVAEGADVHRAP